MKKITGITVSKNYADLLAIAIEHNHDVFDKWYIVTQEDDMKTQHVIKSCGYDNIEMVFYPLVPECTEPGHETMPFVGDDARVLNHARGFNCDLVAEEDLADVEPNVLDNGEHQISNKISFDKGGAIRKIQKFYLPSGDEHDVILLLDSDILLSDELKHAIKTSTYNHDTIYGSLRKDFKSYIDIKQLTNERPYRREHEVDGYFQLYVNTGNRLCVRSANAAGYDCNFTGQFPHKQVIELDAYHMGQSDTYFENWLGRNNEIFDCDL